MFGRPWAWALFALLVLGFPAAVTWWRTPPDLPRYLPAPGFDLVDQTGTPRSTLELRGGVTVVNFIFTRCPDVCPMLSSKAAWLHRELPAQPLGGVPIRIVSITVDPRHDTPAVLAEYAARWEADPARWHFLTGQPEAVQDVIAGFQQAADRGPDGPGGIPNIAHSERFLLIDADNVVRGFYPSDEQGLLDLRRDAARLARAGGT